MASREYYLKNKDKILAYQKQYYDRNNEGIKERVSEYNKKNYIKHLDKKQEYQRKVWNELKIKTLTSLGQLKCNRCDYDDVRALHIDHINGGGNQHKKTFTSNKKYMQYIQLNPQEFQILCANCNYIKRYENKEFRKSKYEIQ